MKEFVLPFIIGVLCFFVCFHVSADVADDAVLVLHFDEESGVYVHDDSGNGNHGEIYDTVRWGEGVSGTTALFFDGTEGYVEIPDSSSIEPQHFTISVWIKPGIEQDSIDYALPILSKTNGDRWFYVDGYDLTLGENGIALGIASRRSYRRGPNAILDLPVDTWSHIVATYDKSEARIYVNGELKTSIQASYGISYGSDDLWIGRFYQVGSSHSGGMDRKGYYYFNGGIDEVILFPRALSGSEVTELYQSYGEEDTPENVITIKMDGDSTIGNILQLQGTNTISDITYLFITGPNLPENGVKLDNFLINSISDDESSFNKIIVNEDNQWSYLWDTYNLKQGIMFPGIYTIYAVSEPKNKNDLTEFATLINNFNLPDKFDWRDWRGENWMSPVKDQGCSGACFAFAVVGAIESKYNIQKNEIINIDLSEYDIYYNNKNPGIYPFGDGGNIVETLYYVQKEGIVDEDCCPYNWFFASLLEPNYCIDRLSRIWKIEPEYLGHYFLPYNSDDIKAALIYKGPIPVSISLWDIEHHAVLLTGWDGKNWIFKNSWGMVFGYFNMQTELNDINWVDSVIPPHAMNPSAVYCTDLGYDYYIEKTSNGDCGYCILPNNQIIEAWEFFLGDNATEYSYCSIKGYQLEQELYNDSQQSKYFTNRCAFCVINEDEKIEVTELMNITFNNTIWKENNNNRPSIEPIQNISVNEGELIKFQINATDPTNDPLTINSAKLPEGAILNINKFTWTPNANQTGQYFISFAVSDGQLESFVFANITVKAINHVSLNVPISPGWALFSTPVTLDPANSTLNKIFDQDAQQHIEVILGWDGNQWFIPDPGYQLTPLHALVIKTDSVVNATLMPSSGISIPPSRILSEGINLVGCAPACMNGTFQVMATDEAFQCIETSQNGLGYVMIISPAWNQPAWAYARGGQQQDLLPFKGYWVVMENPDTLYGFSTTPIS